MGPGSSSCEIEEAIRFLRTDRFHNTRFFNWADYIKSLLGSQTAFTYRPAFLAAIFNHGLFLHQMDCSHLLELCVAESGRRRLLYQTGVCHCGVFIATEFVRSSILPDGISFSSIMNRVEIPLSPSRPTDGITPSSGLTRVGRLSSPSFSQTEVVFLYHRLRRNLFNTGPAVNNTLELGQSIGDFRKHQFSGAGVIIRSSHRKIFLSYIFLVICVSPVCILLSSQRPVEGFY